ncbi:hypothetical protein PMIT1342_01398 [Prochlorococcus marinus str. MIT 1342]|nr:hypothetical protein PMIT1342_01398 [Prochlorococcus marinus str. MIT 1342]
MPLGHAGLAIDSFPTDHNGLIFLEGLFHEQ